MGLQTRDIRPRQDGAPLHSLARVDQRGADPFPEHVGVAAAFDRVVAEVATDSAVLFAPRLPGSPPRVDGYLLALTSLERPPPHGRERHPDGDELVYLESGEVTVVIETPSGEQRHALRPGDALIVPRGLWHRIEIGRPSRLVHLAPGPSGEHRPASPTPTGGHG